MKFIYSGSTVASCSIKGNDYKFYAVDHCSNECVTTPTCKINCTDGVQIATTKDPCEKIAI